mmetsp:Transcript_169491/g.538111  ORF Transcript_169491/g.538111 Transcript_169491/m.538111 type:complete len:248 (-) Transcript_169491:105-848(-)
MRNPSSAGPISFKLAGAVLLLFDVTITPFTLAWNTDSTTAFSTGMAWTSIAFWTLDMASSFFLGFYKGGELVDDLALIRRRYLQTWFVPDLFLLSIDWWNSISLSSAASMRMLRMAKLGKIMRLVVLLRAMRYLRMLQEMADYHLSNLARTLLSLSEVMMFALWLTHIMACAWFSVGQYSDSDTGLRWVLIFEDRDAGLFAQYVISFQWSMAMMTLGAIDVVCTNSSERAFNTLCLSLGLVANSRDR